MIVAATGKPQKVRVMSDNYATFLVDERQLCFVALSAQPGFNCSRDIDTVLTQGTRNIRVNVFVQMEPDAFSHG